MAAPLTRTGKSLVDADASDLFARNPCPQKKYFTGLKHDYIDEHGQKYWVVDRHAKLQSWHEQSAVVGMVEHEFDSNRDTMIYVDKNDATKVNKKEVEVQASSLQAGDRLHLLDRLTLLPYSCEIQAVGQRTTDSSTSTRRMRWLHVRDLQRA